MKNHTPNFKSIFTKPLSVSLSNIIFLCLTLICSATLMLTPTPNTLTNELEKATKPHNHVASFEVHYGIIKEVRFNEEYNFYAVTVDIDNSDNTVDRKFITFKYPTTPKIGQTIHWYSCNEDILALHNLTIQ